MRLNKILAAFVLAAGIVAPSIGQACQWVRVGELGDRLECRSNYRNFIGDNAELFNKLLMESAYLALGSAERLTIDNWAIRNAVTIPEAHELIGNRFDADKMINEMNAIIRQEEALDGEMDGVDVLGVNTPLQLPSAYMVGVTIPFNGDITKVPFLPAKISTFIPQPGGSLFVGWVLIPQKVEFVMNADGTLSGPEEYVTVKEENESEYTDILSTLMKPTDDNSLDSFYSRVRLETRFVVIPSIDAKTGKDGAFKDVYLQPTIGMVFGRNIVKSHQVLNHGPSLSLPGKSLRAARNVSYLGPYMFPEWLLKPIERYVDTIKVGYSFSSQDEFSEPKKDDIMQFNENAFLWLRFGDRMKRVQATSAAAETVEAVFEGKFRWGWFGVIGLKSDGEAKSNFNGLSGEMLSTIGSGISGVVKDLLGRSEEILITEDPATLAQKVKELKESLEADSARTADDAEKLAPAVRQTIEDKIKELEAQIQAIEEAKKKTENK